MTVFRDSTFKEVMKVQLGHMGRPSFNMAGLLIRQDQNTNTQS